MRLFISDTAELGVPRKYKERLYHSNQVKFYRFWWRFLAYIELFQFKLGSLVLNRAIHDFAIFQYVRNSFLHFKPYRGNREMFSAFSVILKRSDSLLEYSFDISYVKPHFPELEKGRSGKVLGGNFSHVSLHYDPCLISPFLGLSNQLSGSNQRPLDYKSDALSIELIRWTV